MQAGIIMLNQTTKQCQHKKGRLASSTTNQNHDVLNDAMKRYCRKGFREEVYGENTDIMDAETGTRHAEMHIYGDSLEQGTEEKELEHQI